MAVQHPPCQVDSRLKPIAFDAQLVRLRTEFSSELHARSSYYQLRPLAAMLLATYGP